MANEIHLKIKNEMNKSRRLALASLEERLLFVYEQLPRYKEIDQKIREIGIDAAQKVIRDPRNADRISEELQNRINELVEDKKKLLLEVGLSENYLEPTFQCAICKDTGILKNSSGSNWCNCYKQKIIELSFEESGFAKDKMATFSKFNTSLFSDKIDHKRFGINQSPKDNILFNKEFSINFIQNDFNKVEGKGLFFSGQTGTGKTFLAECIANEFLQKGVTVVFVSAPAMFDKINEAKMNMYEETSDDYFGALKEAELLVIDDLGTETPSDAKLSNLLQLLNTRKRLDQHAPHKTIISTNLTLSSLRDRYDDRIVSRVIGEFSLLQFVGEDLRVKTR